MTTARVVSIVIVRLFAAYLVLESISQALLTAALLQSDVANEWVFYAATSATTALLGIGIWIWAKPLTSLIVKRDDLDGGEKAPDAYVLVAAGGFLIGMFIVVTTVVDVVHATFQLGPLMQEVRLGMLDKADWNRRAEFALRAWLELLIGVFMAVRPGVLANLFQRFRGAGLGKPAKDSAAD